MGIFSFLKANQNRLAKAEQYFAGNLNLNIRKKQLALLLDENLDTIAKVVYELSAKRAKIKAFNFNGEIGVDTLLGEPEVVQHADIFYAIPKILKKVLPIIILECKNGKSEQETLKLTENIFLPIFIETAERLKSL